MSTKRLSTSIYGLTAGASLQIAPTRATVKVEHKNTGLLSMLWNWARFRRTAQSNAEKLAVTSSVSLGEKRFVAVIQFGELQYLVGGGATNVALLAQLNPNESFGGMLKDSMTARKKSPAKRMKKKTTKPATKQSENAA